MFCETHQQTLSSLACTLKRQLFKLFRQRRVGHTTNSWHSLLYSWAKRLSSSVKSSRTFFTTSWPMILATCSCGENNKQKQWDLWWNLPPWWETTPPLMPLSVKPYPLQSDVKEPQTKSNRSFTITFCCNFSLYTFMYMNAFLLYFHEHERVTRNHPSSFKTFFSVTHSDHIYM